MTVEVADCHNDLLLAVRHERERGVQDPFGDRWLSQLRDGGVRLQVLPVCTEDQFVGEGALRRCLLLIEEARRLAAIHADAVGIAENGQQVRDILDSGRIALVLAIEGAEPIGHSLELVDVMQRAGIRMCSLSWNRRTMMADGIAERDTGGRLTQLGVDAVRRMEELGVVVDVSHLSEAGFFHLAQVARQPFIASHSSCRAVHDHPRNLSDEQLKVVADTGSFVAINAFGPFLAESSPNLGHFVDHVEHAVSMVGPDRVGLGTDFIVEVQEIVDTPFTGVLVDWTDIPQTEGLQAPGDFVGLAALMEERLGVGLARKVLGANLIDFVVDRLA